MQGSFDNGREHHRCECVSDYPIAKRIDRPDGGRGCRARRRQRATVQRMVGGGRGSSADPMFPGSEEAIGHTVLVASRVGLVVVAIAVGAVAAACFPQEDPWRARVLSVNDTAVCTEQLEPGRHPGGERPCLPVEGVLVTLEQLRVGDCVELNIHHPDLVLERKIPCPGR